MYVYKQTQPELYTVGHYEPSGKWIPESDHNQSEEAAKRVAYLNGKTGGFTSGELADIKAHLAAMKDKPIMINSDFLIC